MPSDPLKKELVKGTQERYQWRKQSNMACVNFFLHSFFVCKEHMMNLLRLYWEARQVFSSIESGIERLFFRIRQFGFWWCSKLIIFEVAPSFMMKKGTLWRSLYASFFYTKLWFAPLILQSSSTYKIHCTHNLFSIIRGDILNFCFFVVFYMNWLLCTPLGGFILCFFSR